MYAIFGSIACARSDSSPQLKPFPSSVSSSLIFPCFYLLHLSYSLSHDSLSSSSVSVSSSPFPWSISLDFLLQSISSSGDRMTSSFFSVSKFVSLPLFNFTGLSSSVDFFLRWPGGQIDDMQVLEMSFEIWGNLVFTCDHSCPSTCFFFFGSFPCCVCYATFDLDLIPISSISIPKFLNFCEI